MTGSFFAAIEVTKRFDGLTAVANLSLAIDKGEIVGVFGPNGSGKTTLLNLIAGVYTPTSGRILWKGAEMNALKPHEIAAAGIVKTFQNPQLFPELNVVDHVMIAAHLRLKRSQGLARVATLWNPGHYDRLLMVRGERVMELCRLTAVRAEPARNLSYGDEKMLGVAMALMCDPELLLLDEPATGLGQDEIRNLTEVLHDLRTDGTTLCIIDHRIGFLSGLANRAIAMHHGAKIAEGPPNEVLKDKAVVEAYLGHQHA